MDAWRMQPGCSHVCCSLASLFLVLFLCMFLMRLWISVASLWCDSLKYGFNNFIAFIFVFVLFTDDPKWFCFFYIAKLAIKLIITCSAYSQTTFIRPLCVSVSKFSLEFLTLVKKGELLELLDSPSQRQIWGLLNSKKQHGPSKTSLWEQL